MKEVSDVKVFEQRPVDDNGLMVFKGEGVVRAPFAKVASVLFDTSRAKEWVDHLEETRILKWLDANTMLEYDHVGAPILISDRDFVTKVEMVYHPENSGLDFVMSDPREDEIPTDLAKSKWVRGSLHRTKYSLIPVENGKATLMIGEVHADPRGSIPKWLVNFFQKDWPVTTLVNLRKQLAKSDIKNDPKIVELLKTHLKLTSEEVGE